MQLQSFKALSRITSDQSLISEESPSAECQTFVEVGHYVSSYMHAIWHCGLQGQSAAVAYILWYHNRDEIYYFYNFQCIRTASTLMSVCNCASFPPILSSCLDQSGMLWSVLDKKTKNHLLWIISAEIWCCSVKMLWSCGLMTSKALADFISTSFNCNKTLGLKVHITHSTFSWLCSRLCDSKFLTQYDVWHQNSLSVCLTSLPDVCIGMLNALAFPGLKYSQL